jgi:uncharacterized protein with HEPN domain
MLDFAEEAVNLCSGRSREDLDNDRLFNLALVRLMEITGEAANRVPFSFQAKHPEIAWSQIINLRNRLIHGYDQVDFNILWLIVKNDIPVLVTQLKTLLL